MTNPWKEVALSDYESHMSLDNVYQAQTLDKIMERQFAAYPISSVAIMGVAGGNGLANLATLPSITTVYGIDINADYLKASAERHPELAGRYTTVLADINSDSASLPHAGLVVANLFVEYVGCANFTKAVKRMDPDYVSCVIQEDPGEGFVSESPYASRLGVLDSVHNSVDAAELTATLASSGYESVATESEPLPNGKIFRRLDYKRACEPNQAPHPHA